MKKTILTILIMFYVIFSFTQNWAPIGATWYYTEQYFTSGDIDYFKIQSDKDTVFNGILCRKIIKYDYPLCSDRSAIEFMYSRNDTVFFYDTIFHEFQILYDFNAQVNDGWIIKTFDYINPSEPDTIFVKVDSVGSIVVNGNILKKLFVTNHRYIDPYNDLSYPSEIIEKIGDFHYLFNFYPQPEIACDGNFSSGLRCYYDSIIGQFETGIADSCDYTYDWVGINKCQIQNNIQINPNPVISNLTFTGINGRKLRYSILNISNQIVRNKNELKEFINLNELQKGIYFLYIYNEQNIIIQVERLIKI